MYHIKVFVLIALALVILLAACGKAAQPANPTLTFGNNTCSYSGPKSVSFGTITLNIVLPKRNPLSSGFALVTLQKGKTIADLEAGTSTDPPTWATDLDDQEYLMSGRSYTYDLSRMSLYHPYEPLFLVCFQMNAKGDINKIGAFGPITVQE